MNRTKEESFITGTQRPEEPVVLVEENAEAVEEIAQPIVKVVDTDSSDKQPVLTSLEERKEPETPNLSDVEKLLEELNSKK